MILRTLGEAAGVVFAGLLFALAANQVSPRGLSLRRDYFPAATPASVATQPPTTTTGAAAPGTVSGLATTPGDPPAVSATNRPPDSAAEIPDALRSRLAARGLSAIGFDGARALFEDPRRAQDLVVFVDARNDSHYAEAHIPGAYQFDHYYPDRYLANLLPVVQHAESIVVYCTGGDCEDSEFAATALKDTGIPPERLSVYVGGVDDWKSRGMPLETGVRGSGQLPEGRP